MEWMGWERNNGGVGGGGSPLGSAMPQHSSSNFDRREFDPMLSFTNCRGFQVYMFKMVYCVHHWTR
jgi:hypothetical protein